MCLKIKRHIKNIDLALEVIEPHKTMVSNNKSHIIIMTTDRSLGRSLDI
jgi:hypothetical protein